MSYTLIQQRRDSAANWFAKNPVLKEGEIGIDQTNKIFKIGDGKTPWSGLKRLGMTRDLFDAKGNLTYGSGPGDIAKLPRGNVDQRLSVRSDGVLMWVDAATGDEFAKQTDITNPIKYETLANAFYYHSAAITKEVMSESYETIADSTAAHATFMTPAQAAALYVPKTSPLLDAYQNADYLSLKYTDTPALNTTALGLDPELEFSAVAGGTYAFEFFLSVIGTVAAGIKVAIQLPAGSNIVWGVHGAYSLTAGSWTSDITHQLNYGVPTTPVALALSGPTIPLNITIKGAMVIGSTAGLAGLQFAQNAADNTSATIVRAGSYMRVHQAA